MIALEDLRHGTAQAGPLIDNPGVLEELAKRLAQDGRRCASKHELTCIAEQLEQATPVQLTCEDVLDQEGLQLVFQDTHNAAIRCGPNQNFPCLVVV